jgi:hypothetical protein
MKFCVPFLLLFAAFQIYVGVNGCMSEAKANTAAEQEHPAKVIYSERFTGSEVTRIVDEEMKIVCYVVYRYSVGTSHSISCVHIR